MTSTTQKPATLTLLLLILVLAAGTVKAGPITLDLQYTGFANGSTSGTLYDQTSSKLIGGQGSLGVQAGMFAFNILDTVGDSPFEAGSTLYAFCIETGIALHKGETQYTLINAADYTFSGAQLQAFEQLYAGNHGALGAKSGDVAFQLAAWEILNETTADYALSGDDKGTFYSSDFQGARATADSWLSVLAEHPVDFHMYVLKAGNSQDLLVFGPPVTVPEPAMLTLLGTGLLVIAVVSMRRRLSR
ncbi:hypothetical protein B1C78_01055 [Thioalkalivibrio denitrificans]|uniref:Ice-binding protein C-terminal domain-containing protein n=1 Tax=Thioalkalivibrio denitrificans TaxID=108003 RepID=A0A1V3NVG6_9GAMM|nr:PEP-CTERM sorting domain-containing protein [Thioalkalivibrio denitrificans]OOG28716.1 hypothetical protein B1C78_01055 [Thioalkalivibrio denitrificans]